MIAPYVLGAVLTLTGPYAPQGLSQAQMLAAMVSRIDETGGIDGHPLEVRVIDDAGDGGRAAAAVRQLAGAGDVLAIIGSSEPGTTAAMEPVAAQVQIGLQTLAPPPATAGTFPAALVRLYPKGKKPDRFAVPARDALQHLVTLLAQTGGDRTKLRAALDRG